jgi:hypothetical protein
VKEWPQLEGKLLLFAAKTRIMGRKNGKEDDSHHNETPPFQSFWKIVHLLPVAPSTLSGKTFRKSSSE